MTKKQLIIKAFEQLDAGMLDVLLNDDMSYQDVPKQTFVNKLKDYFEIAKSDEEIYENDRLDVMEEQSDFVTESSRLKSLIELLHSDNKMPTDEKIDTTKKYIDEFCTKWNLTHATSV